MRDLGQLDGEIIGFGGVHSNLHALKALIAVVGARSAICTGDVVAYCSDPAGSVDLLRGTGWPVIAGNCEQQIAEDADDCGCGFGEGTVCDLKARAWYAHARSALDGQVRTWMAELPEIAVFTAHGRRWAVIHGGATSINRFIWPNSDEAALAEEMAATSAQVGKVDAVLAGHSGIPFIREVAGVTWVNAGAIGMPPHDGGSETRYVVISEEGVRIERLVYDAQGAHRAMVAAGLTQGYEQTLLTGWWPSEEILPPALRRALPADGAPQPAL